MKNNPFVINRYENPKYFCDRTETIELIQNKLNSKENIFLCSANGLGKTSLLKHLFFKFDQEKSFNYIYIDVFKFSDHADLFIAFLSTVLKTFNSKSSKKINVLNEIIYKKSSPNISLLSEFSDEELEIKFNDVLSFLKTLKIATIVVIDNFQFSRHISSKFFTDSFLAQHKKDDNIRIIISGTESSTEMDGFAKICLEKIPEDDYKRFIYDLFSESGRIITKKSLSLIYTWTDGETSAIQLLCSKLWNYQVKKIKSSFVKEVINSILLESNCNLIVIRNLLSSYQWRLLKAIAVEGLANQVTSSNFMRKYKLNAPSSVKTALTALIDKDLIVREGTSYKIPNIILSKGLASA